MNKHLEGFQLQAGITSCYRPTLDALAKDFGGGVLKHSRTKRQKQAWQWRVCGEGALHFLRAISPWLREKRSQANIVIGSYSTAKKGVKLTPKQKAVRKMLNLELRRLKSVS